MAERDDEEKTVVDTVPEADEAGNLSLEVPRDVDTCVENQMPSQQNEEEIIKKKYGGLLAKKPPLISSDHERAFFDSADWALGKKSKGPIEALRPKLQPSPHHQARSRSPCAPADNAEGDSIPQQDDGNCDDLNNTCLSSEAQNLQG